VSAARKTRSTTPIPLPEGVEHGTVQGYVVFCGCTGATSPTGHGCTEAKREYDRERRDKQRQARDEFIARETAGADDGPTPPSAPATQEGCPYVFSAAAHPADECPKCGREAREHG
jgi:hypothetical protein